MEAGQISESALVRDLRAATQRWVVTGAAGFIGSHIVHQLLACGQTVVGLDNFATGHPRNLAAIQRAVDAAAWARFRFVEGDIRDPRICADVCTDANFVLHQAALGSVPRSIHDPKTSNSVNVDGFLTVLVAARDAGVSRFVYASSSSVYGDHPDLPKQEQKIGKPLSPYAITKYANELYASVFAAQYGINVTGLRYFNVFGPRQDPAGPYAAVIPRWLDAINRGAPCTINGDGETSRDFCFVLNAVHANILAGLSREARSAVEVFNVACGEQTSLNQLHELLAAAFEELTGRRPPPPVYTNFRSGDVRHSLADVAAISRIGYQPTHRIGEGVALVTRAFLQSADEQAALEAQ